MILVNHMHRHADGLHLGPQERGTEHNGQALCGHTIVLSMGDHTETQTGMKGLTRAACSLVPNVHDWDLEGWWFKPHCSHDKISAAVEPLSKALNPKLLQGGLSTA